MEWSGGGGRRGVGGCVYMLRNKFLSRCFHSLQCAALFKLSHVPLTLAVFAVYGLTLLNRTSNFRRRHRTCGLPPNFGRLRVRVGRAASEKWSCLQNDFSDSWLRLVATVQERTVPSSRVVFCATPPHQTPASPTSYPRHATETVLYGRLSFLDELFTSHVMISMVLGGFVSECHESVPSTHSCLTGGISAAKA